MHTEIEIKSGHLFWAKNRQKGEVIDIQGLYNNYWSSNKREFLVSSQSKSPSGPLISDREVQGTLSLASIIAP